MIKLRTKKMKQTIDTLEKIAGPLNLGSLLHAIRVGEELSQVEFSKLLGISKQNLCDIENGRRFVSPKKAEEFAKKTGHSSTQFVRLCLQDILKRDGISFGVELVS